MAAQSSSTNLETPEEIRNRLLDILKVSPRAWSPIRERRKSTANAKGDDRRATNEERAAVVEKPDDEHRPTIPVLLRVLEKKGVTIKELKRVPAYEDLKRKAKEGS
ncbi:MAG: hypothetical protein Q9215_005093 [Flavoplaca cf. flavocitrina]